MEIYETYVKKYAEEIVEKKNVALAIVVAVPGVTPRAVARWPIGSNRLSPPGPTEPV